LVITLKRLQYELLFKALFYPEFTLFFLFCYLYDAFLEYHFGNTYFKRTLFLPVLLYAQFFGAKLYQKIILSNGNQINLNKKNKILAKEKEINILKLKYLDIGNKVNNVKI